MFGKVSDLFVTKTTSPAIILVHSQLGENIGMAARAMHNCRLKDLRLVSPRQDWLSDKSIAASAGGADILKNASFYETTEEAIADLHFVGAATARQRDIVKPVKTPRQFSSSLLDKKELTIKAGCLFGREKSGLRNHEISLADVIVEVPLNPDYSSLNLAQAVLIIAYEWFQLDVKPRAGSVSDEKSLPGTKQQLDMFFQHLEGELDSSGFLRVKEKRPGMILNIRAIFQRAGLTDQEIQTLHGIVTELRYGGRSDRPKRNIWKIKE